MPHVFGWTFSLNSVTPRSPWPPPPVGKKSWTLPDVLIVLTKGSPWCHLPNLRSPDLEIQALTDLLASVQPLPASEDTRMLPPPHREGCRARCPRHPDSCSRLPASLQGSWQNRTQKNKAPRLSLRPCLPDFQDPQSPPECALAPCPHSRGADCSSLASQCPVRVVQRFLSPSFSFPAALIYQA